MGDDERIAQARHWLDVQRPARCLEVLGDLEPRDEVVELRVRALLMLERWTDAIELAKRGLAEQPANLNLHLWLAHALDENRDPLAAEHVLAAALRIAPDNVVLLTSFAEQITSTMHFDRADRALERAAELDPESIEVDIARVQWCHARGDKRGAAMWLQRALEKDPEDVRALQLAGQLALRSGRAADGRDRLHRAALQRMGSDRLVDVARRSSTLGRRPWSWFMPGLRVSQIAVGVVGLVVIFGGSALVRDGNPVLGWAALAVWGGVAVYSWIAWLLIYVVMDD